MARRKSRGRDVPRVLVEEREIVTPTSSSAISSSVRLVEQANSADPRLDPDRGRRGGM
jgi:hypothetical protein